MAEPLNRRGLRISPWLNGSGKADGYWKVVAAPGVADR